MQLGFPSLVSAADRALALVGVPAAGAGAYLAALATRRAKRFPIATATPLVQLAVVVPAHNERLSIVATIASLLATTYPVECRRIIVVADNCSDDTATLAREAGAEVWERTDLTKRGKGYALEFAFNRLLDEADCDAVVVVDADTLVTPNLLSVCSQYISAGAEAVQVDYKVRNTTSSWRTRLLHISFTAFHDVRSSGRESLALSCGLRGNGMAFTRATLMRVPHTAFSIVEDLEYGISLAEAGIRVAYAGEASVAGEMPDDAKSSESQRSRWEGGRALIRQRDGKRLAMASIRKRDKVLADIAADLLIPPLGQLGTFLAGGTVASAFLVVAGHPAGRRRLVSPWVFGLGVAGLVIHVGEAWRRSGAGLRGFADLARVPWYVGWKFAQKFKLRKQGSSAEWVRTTRLAEQHRSPQYVSPESGQRQEGPQ